MVTEDHFYYSPAKLMGRGEIGRNPQVEKITPPKKDEARVQQACRQDFRNVDLKGCSGTPVGKKRSASGRPTRGKARTAKKAARNGSQKTGSGKARPSVRGAFHSV